jgi:hypothetical protein
MCVVFDYLKKKKIPDHGNPRPDSRSLCGHGAVGFTPTIFFFNLMHGYYCHFELGVLQVTYFLLDLT